jgi:hypothetical protein
MQPDSNPSLKNASICQCSGFIYEVLGALWGHPAWQTNCMLLFSLSSFVSHGFKPVPTIEIFCPLLFKSVIRLALPAAKFVGAIRP